MNTKRVLFFGVTGVEKTGGEATTEGWGVLRRLARWVEDNRKRSPRPKVVDFETEYLFNPRKGGKVSYSFLGDNEETQREIWRDAWTRFASEYSVSQERDLFVAMHGCIVRGHYGVRSVVDAEKLAAWVKGGSAKSNKGKKSKSNCALDMVVTLIDDVYDMWWRTEKRAEGMDLFGRPTIEQLLYARRTELIVADQVAHSVDPPIPHFVISVAHPCETLANRIYSTEPTVIYLCFPISAPRDLKARDNDNSGINEIMGFLRDAYVRQHKNESLVIVCPLGIDELPLVGVAKAAIRELDPKSDIEKAKPLVFDRDGLRWSMDSVWAANACLSPGPLANQDRVPIPLAQLDAACGMIHSDVAWRDYRLVSQCGQTGCLASYNPKFRKDREFSRSVRREIGFATGICPVFVYQNRENDPNGQFEADYPRGGTMGPPQGELMVVRKNSVKELFDEIEQLGNRRKR